MIWAKAGNLAISTSAGQRLSAVMARTLPSAAARIIPFMVNATRLTDFSL
jgi:hypothetical protein